MQNIPFSETICLSSANSGEEQPVEEITNSRFEQNGRLFRCEGHFRIFNDHNIEVSTSGVFRPVRHYQLDCAFLDPNPVRRLRIDWWCAGMCLVLLTALAVLTWQAPHLSVAKHVVWISGSLLLLGASLSLGICLFRSRDRVVFYTRHGRAPLLKLLNRNPTATQLQDFVSDISRRIEQARANQDGKAEFLSAELREHRRLKDQGILTAQAYEVVKMRLLRAHGLQ